MPVMPICALSLIPADLLTDLSNHRWVNFISMIKLRLDHRYKVVFYIYG